MEAKPYTDAQIEQMRKAQDNHLDPWDHFGKAVHYMIGSWLATIDAARAERDEAQRSAREWFDQASFAAKRMRRAEKVRDEALDCARESAGIALQQSSAEVERLRGLLREAKSVLDKRWFIGDDNGDEHNDDEVIEMSERIDAEIGGE